MVLTKSTKIKKKNKKNSKTGLKEFNFMFLNIYYIFKRIGMHKWWLKIPLTMSENYTNQRL